MKNKSAKVALRTCLIYAVIGCAWILFSGRMLFVLVSNPDVRMQMEIYKGWAFIAVTALLLYFALLGQLRRWEREVVERKRSEEELFGKTALLEAQVNSSLDGILVVDAEGKKILQNQRMNEMWKFPPEIADNRDDAAQLQFVMSRIKNPGLFAEKVAYLYSHPDEVSWDEVELLDGPVLQRSSSPVFGKDSKYYGRIWTFRDITTRKRAEENLIRERELLRTLIDLLPETFYVKDLDSRFLIANKALAKHLGKESPSQIIGRSDADFFPAEQAAEYRAAELKVLGGEPLIDYEGDGISPTGRRCTHLTTKVPFRDSQGRVQGLVGIGRDITERKQTEESHLRLATAVEQAAEAVIVTDTDGKILYVNPAFEAVTGYAQKEIIGQNTRILKSGRHDDIFYRRMWAVLANGAVWSGRLINKRKDGTLFEEEATISPVRDSNGRITNFVAVKRDVTHEVQLENQFRQSQKMEAFGQLAGGVAHDFNNLLTVIQGSASLLLNPQLDPGDRSGCSRQIVHAAERAASLTRQLLMFSRKHALQVVTLNLNEVVGNMTKMLQRILGEDIVLHAEYDPKIAAVSADAGMIEQVLLNLAVNSRDAMPKGGQLLIATSQEKLEADHPPLPADMAPGTYVCLKVTDTGCGIAPEVLPHIFEPFFTTKATGKGTGLGLATVYGIIQQHHGWVTVTSESGRGATFYVYLPAAAGAPAQVEAASPPKLPPGTETILLTEDEPSVRALASNILRRCGYTILPAESGVAALEIWREYRDKIQLLLTDIIMPDGMTGYDLAQQLKLERPHLKVIYTSGYTGDILSRYPTLIRDHCFLQKPYQPYRLAQTVRDCLDEESGGAG